MNIAIDGRPLLKERSGVGRYTYELIRAMLAAKCEHNFYLYGLSGLCGCSYTFIPSVDWLDLALKSSKLILVPFPFRKLSRTISTLIIRLKKSPDIHINLWTNFMGDFYWGGKSIITIHDMAYYYYPQYIIPGKAASLSRRLRSHAGRADLILSVSENTKKDIVRFLNVPEEKVWVTYNGVGDEFRVIDNKDLLKDVRLKYNIPERFILFVGTVEPRKNIARLVEAYHILNSRYRIKEPLVIAGGKGWKNAAIYQTIRQLKLEDRIIFTGYVSDEDLPLLYNAATVFAYPSLYEGFGIPVIEAMACGVPVVTSNVSSLPEVAGNAAILINPEDPEAIAFAMHKIITYNELYNNLRELGLKQAAKFTWESCASKTLEAISFVAEKGRRNDQAVKVTG